MVLALAGPGASVPKRARSAKTVCPGDNRIRSPLLTPCWWAIRRERARMRARAPFQGTRLHPSGSLDDVLVLDRMEEI